MYIIFFQNSMNKYLIYKNIVLFKKEVRWKSHGLLLNLSWAIS